MKKNTDMKTDWYSIYDSDDDVPLTASWPESIVYCNMASLMMGYTPVYYYEDRETVILSWEDVEKGPLYINWKTNGFRLPTEAEWEFAARGGNETQGFQYAGSNSLDEVAWNDLTGEVHFRGMPVGEKKPNELGLYDMSGNVAEWCFDIGKDPANFRKSINPGRADFYDQNETIAAKIIKPKAFYASGSDYGDHIPVSENDYNPRTRKIAGVGMLIGIRLVRNNLNE